MPAGAGASLKVTLRLWVGCQGPQALQLGRALEPVCNAALPGAFWLILLRPLHSAQKVLCLFALLQPSQSTCHSFLPLAWWPSPSPGRTARPLWFHCLAPQP